GDLLRRRLYFHRVHVDSAVVVLAESQDGSWNYIRILPSLGPTPLPVRPGWGSWLALSDVQVADADLTVRTRWRPDSTLARAAHDSAIRATLGPDSRLDVVAVVGGYEQSSAF